MHRGTRINDRYELESPLNHGGMGDVWIGRDVKLERQIAVKFVRFPNDQPDQDLVRRFVRESRITARLAHPGVPAVYDVGTHDGRPFLVMQRIQGITIADLIVEHDALPVGWAAAIAAQTCTVLAVAHQASLVHRDLKPRNLMLDPDGCVTVLDFGLAVALDHADVSQITRTGQTLGTPAYMAPEQILAGISGPRTDLYALGCTLHEMLSGRPVFGASTPYALMNQQVDARPPALRSLRPDVPASLERLVLALLSKKPEDRPGTADQVYRDLLPFATDLGPLPEALHTPPTPSPIRMYAEILARVDAGQTGPATTGSTPVAGSPGTGRDGSGADSDAPTSEWDTAQTTRFSRSELDRARNEASRLIEQSRYSQAAEVLSAVVAPASQVFGSVDDDVVSLRLHLADVLFEGGDYHRASPAYHQLAIDLTNRYPPDAQPVRDCRLREATCHALVGQTGLALQQLDDLLRDERRILGEDDPRVLDLRQQIGLLQLGAGDREAAEATLQHLMDDLVRLYGSAHPTVATVANVLTSLRR